MTGSLSARLRRLEGGVSGDIQPKGLLLVPAGVSPLDAAAGELVAERRERTGWYEVLVVLPDNGRGDAL